ncbi:MAG: CAAX prenyl protease-related protein [Verrucomicrobiota bacterium]
MGRLSAIRENKTAAYIVPLAVFMAIQPLGGLFEIDHSGLPWYRSAPEHWVYPLQTVVCLLLLAFFWRNYEFRPIRGTGLAVVMALVGMVAWFLPSYLYRWLDVESWVQPMVSIPMIDSGSPIWRYFGLAPREEGFDPTLFSEQPFWFAAVVFVRFLRMVVVVAFVEEIFWRGFLMRYLVNPEKPFYKIPFGKHRWLAYWVTTLAFMAIHLPEDWLGAFVYGSLTYFVAVKTKSLYACVLMHGVANLVLGVYVMSTGEWGFW